MTPTIADRVKRVLTEMFPEVETIDAAATFDSMHLDSLDTVELLIELEDEFCIELDDVEWMNVKTVQQAIDLVAKTGAVQGVS